MVTVFPDTVTRESGRVISSSVTGPAVFTIVMVFVATAVTGSKKLSTIFASTATRVASSRGKEPPSVGAVVSMMIDFARAK